MVNDKFSRKKRNRIELKQITTTKKETANNNNINNNHYSSVRTSSYYPIGGHIIDYVYWKTKWWWDAQCALHI